MCMMCLKYRIILLIVIKNPLVILLTYFLLRGAAPYPAAGALTAPLRPFDIPTFSSASTVCMRLSFLHLAINLICRRAVATSVRKLQRKHRKMWQNATLFMMIFCRKKQRTNAKSSGTKVADRQHVGA